MIAKLLSKIPPWDSPEEAIVRWDLIADKLIHTGDTEFSLWHYTTAHYVVTAVAFEIAIWDSIKLQWYARDLSENIFLFHRRAGLPGYSRRERRIW